MQIRPLLGRIKRKFERASRRRLVTRKAKVVRLTQIFEARNGYAPNLTSPQTLNEKLLWYKLYYRDELMTRCADKLAVRDYVTEVLGEGFVPQLFGSWDRAHEIAFDGLPDSFALKFNAGSGANLMCESKADFDQASALRWAQSWFKPTANYYLRSFEWVYKDIKPKVFAEELLGASDGDLHDYKFFCFDGQAAFGYITSHRDGAPFSDYFDVSGKLLPFQRTYPRPPTPATVPAKWGHLAELAGRLAQPFPHVRVDFYLDGDRILVGELTFYSGDAVEPITPDSWDRNLGALWTLPTRVHRLPLFELLPYE